MKNLALAFTAIILSAVLMTSCQKEVTDCTDNTEFCALIQAEEYNQAGTIINNYLVGQKKSHTNAEKLEQLKVWLACKSCVANVSLVCNSCIKTKPPQSEFHLRFEVDGEKSAKYLDIIMGEPLRFRTFHD